MIRTFLGLLFHPLLWKFILWAILCLAIWFIGPLFAFSDWRPLEPISYRVMLIALLISYILIKKLLSFWRGKRINERFMQALATKGMADNSNNSVLEELGKNFSQAMNHLKSSAGANNSGFLNSLSRRFVYQFPWYVFIGAPGSGKTTALINSGLQFPLSDVMGQESLKGVAGTRNCDWWFTDDAVFIDTAGRYITHESNAEQDKEEWAGFLGLLKKFRPRQPLNGAVLTVSVADLLVGSESSRERHATIIRSRLNELGKTLGINFPVYILITKADLLGGFTDYFDNLAKEERDQVLGFTLPDYSEQDVDIKALIRQELELIARHLFDRLPDLLINESDMSRRAHTFSFPQNFSNSLELIIDLVDKVFSGTDNFGVQIRGVYFTSGTQEGTPLDRVLGALGRKFGVSSTINTHKKSSAGRSYFLKDLVTKVILPEAHLAGKNRNEEKKELWLGLISHSAVLLGFLLVFGFLANSYYKNQDYLKQVHHTTQMTGEALTELARSDTQALVDYLPVLNSLCCLADGEDFSANSPPLAMTFGLYQGNKLDAASQRTYQRALQATLLPLVARRLEQLLVSANDQDMDYAYQALKAYLMLNQPEHYNQAQLLRFVERDFRQEFSADLSREQQAAILFHLGNLLSEEAQISPFVMDNSLVQSKRRLLSGFSFADRAYQTIKGGMLQRSSMPDISFLTAGGAKSNFVFERATGKSLSDGIPNFFTREGYHQYFLPAVQKQLKDIVQEESWVLGDYSSFTLQAFTPARIAEVEQALVRLYLQDYASIWDAYLLDLRLIATRSMSESIDVARILSAEDSPLIQLITRIAPELSLSKNLSPVSEFAAKEAGKRIAEKMSGFDKSIQGMASSIITSDSLESIVDSRFKELIELTYGANKEANKNSLLKIFNEVYLSLSNADFSIRSGSRAPVNNEVLEKIRIEASRYPVPIRNVLEGLTEEGKRQTDGGIRGALNAELESTVGEFCRVAINGRYPFDRRSTRDVTFADFSKLFAPAGMMDSFFNENLRAITDTTGRNWVLRQATNTQLSIGSFQRAARIRDVFFPSAARAPVLNFEYKVLEMDAGISQLSMDFDGQLFQYAHGPQIPRTVTWPGPLGSNQIRIELSGNNEVNRKSLVVNGPWAIMRLFDQGERRQIQPEKFITTLNIQGQKVVLEITASSVNNPFYLAELASFTCPTRS